MTYLEDKREPLAGRAGAGTLGFSIINSASILSPLDVSEVLTWDKVLLYPSLAFSTSRV